MATAYIALGANLGDRRATLKSAIQRLSTLGNVTAKSSIYETAPVGFADQPAYLNAVVEVQTNLTAEETMQVLLDIEREHGRERSFPNAPRTLDLDLLLFDELLCATDFLTLPHPRMHERAFVLTPLVEIAPALLIPGLGRSVASLLIDLQPVEGIEFHSRL